MRDAKGATNPFDDPVVAARYETWYQGEGRVADRLEKALLGELLSRLEPARLVLEVGCGTGHFTRWLQARGLDCVGLDVSSSMLAEARRTNSGMYVRGDAAALPFASGAFDLAAIITALEFVPDPLLALREASRVARDGLLLGVMNRWSLLAARRKLSGGSTWRTARFFGAAELAALVEHAMPGRVASIVWRTTLWPVPGVGALPLPWGGFIGMAVRFKGVRT